MRCVAGAIFHQELMAEARWNRGGRRENEESEREERVKKMMIWGERCDEAEKLRVIKRE